MKNYFPLDGKFLKHVKIYPDFDSLKPKMTS